VAGAIAVLILFTYTPLLFDHGLRTNGMDAALVLAYVGGVYHYLRWQNAETGDRAVRHAVAVGAYVALGLMTKFVAVAFLPLILLAGSAPFAAARDKLRRAWRLWFGVAAGVLVCCAPWFAYMRWQVGPYFWQAILGQQVYTRFTAYLDPGHIQPWTFYWRSIYSGFFYPRSVILVIAGTLVVALECVRRRWFEGTLVLAWCALPLVLLSLVTSKLIHYAHPFVVPLALAAGYLGTLVLWLGPVPLEKFTSRRPLVVRIVLLAVGAVAAALAIDSALHGEVRWQLTEAISIRNSGVSRPLFIGLLCGAAATMNSPARTIAALLLLVVLPVPAYATTIRQLRVENHPLRDARDCLLRRQSEGAASGLYVDIPPEQMHHPIYYYFRRVRPWTRAPSLDPDAVTRVLADPSPRPVLMADGRYDPAIPTGVTTARFGDIRLLLPGAYSVCAEPGATVR